MYCVTRAATADRLEEFERIKNGVRRKFHAFKHNERVRTVHIVFLFLYLMYVTPCQGEAYLNHLGNAVSRRSVVPDTVHVEYTPELVCTVLSCSCIRMLMVWSVANQCSRLKGVLHESRLQPLLVGLKALLQSQLREPTQHLCTWNRKQSIVSVCLGWCHLLSLSSQWRIPL